MPVYEPKPVATPPAPENKPRYPAPKIKREKKKLLIIFAVLLVLASAAAYLLLKPAKSPIPPDIKKSVSFPIYYPDPAQLAPGYSLQLSSFQVREKALLYSVTYAGNQKKLVISETAKPTPDVINFFLTQRIPLHYELHTPVGTASVGAIGSQTVISLVANDKTWLIITGPANLLQKQLEPVLKILKPAN
jgi:hypothetical protein